MKHRKIKHTKHVIKREIRKFVREHLVEILTIVFGIMLLIAMIVFGEIYL